LLRTILPTPNRPDSLSAVYSNAHIPTAAQPLQAGHASFRTPSPSIARVASRTIFHKLPPMCHNAIFYYTFCSCERGFVVWDAGDPEQQDWAEDIENEPETPLTHGCEDGRSYPLHRAETRALEDCASQISERPCFGRFAMKLELWTSILRCDRLHIDRVGGNHMQITYQDTAQTFTPFFKHTVRQRSAHVGAAVEMRERQDTDEDQKRSENKDESSTEASFSATEEQVEAESLPGPAHEDEKSEIPQESIVSSEGVGKSKTPRTVEEKAARLERLRKGTALANQQAANIDRRDSTGRLRTDSAVSVSEQFRPQEGHEQQAIALEEVTPSETIRTQSPEPLLSSPLIQPPVRSPELTISTLPKQIVPPITYSYTALRFPPGYSEEPAIADDVHECSDEGQPLRDQWVPNMARHHTIAGDTRDEVAKFMSNHQSVGPCWQYATPCSQQMPQRITYHTISSSPRPVDLPFVPDQQSKARPSIHGTRQQPDSSGHPTNSSRLRPAAPDFVPAELTGRERTIGETIAQKLSLRTVKRQDVDEEESHCKESCPRAQSY
jgi:hypothetical protein